jgi:CheY-like chemotaxis protein
MQALPTNNRILIVDDNQAIHHDFHKILSPTSGLAELEAAEASMFGVEAKVPMAAFQLESAYQGKEALELVRKSAAEQRPYAMAFMDIRMPPGWDGIETTQEIWKIDPHVQIVICTAYSDYSWNHLREKLGQTDRVVILKKPFDNVEVLQLAHALCEKWRLLQQTHLHVSGLEKRLDEHTAKLRETTRQLEMEIVERKRAETALRESH